MSRLTEILGVRHPIVLAPMAGVAGGRLARAVSAAGGLGMIGTRGSSTPQQIHEQVRVAAEGGAPFGIGLMAWVPGLPAQLEAILALEGDERPALVSVSFGPLAEPVAALHEAGLRVACQVGNTADIDEALAADADLLVARGGEGGGHGRDEMATADVLAAALAATDRPVLAAGGIADADDVARVMAAGAAGAWCGTAFLTCSEGENSSTARAAIAAATDTRYSRVHDVAQQIPWPREFGGRAVATPFVREWAGREEEMTEEARAEHAAGRERADTDYTPLYAGVGVDRLTGPTDAASVVAQLAARI